MKLQRYLPVGLRIGYNIQNMFSDRTDAGIQLGERLQDYRKEDVVVLAVPRGGLPVAALIAKALDVPLDVALSKKLGHPLNKEYAIGAVSMENVILSDAEGISEVYIKEETRRIREILKIRFDQYYEQGSPINLKNKTVIIVDDGIATGNTIMATVDLAKTQHPEKIVVAVPVAPKSTIRKLENLPNVDDVVCLQTPFNFYAVGQFYTKFPQLSDEEAIRILRSARKA